MTDHTTRRRFVALGAAAGVAAIAGCAGGGSEPTDGGDDSSPTDDGSGDGWVSTDTVGMTDDLGYDPKRIVVSAGTTVTFENTSSIGHSVTAYEDDIPDGADYFASGGFDSEQAAVDAYPEEGNMEEGDVFEHTFETTGTYEYYCIPHEMNGMVGSVKVE